MERLSEGGTLMCFAVVIAKPSHANRMTIKSADNKSKWHNAKARSGQWMMKMNRKKRRRNAHQHHAHNIGCDIFAFLSTFSTFAMFIFCVSVTDYFSIIRDFCGDNFCATCNNLATGWCKMLWGQSYYYLTETIHIFMTTSLIEISHGIHRSLCTNDHTHLAYDTAQSSKHNTKNSNNRTSEHWCYAATLKQSR